MLKHYVVFNDPRRKNQLECAVTFPTRAKAIAFAKKWLWSRSGVYEVKIGRVTLDKNWTILKK